MSHSKHIVPWTTWITIAFILGVLVHVLIFAPLSQREDVRQLTKVAAYVSAPDDYIQQKRRDTAVEMSERYEDMNSDVIINDMVAQAEAITEALKSSIVERETGKTRELYAIQSAPPPPTPEDQYLQITGGDSVNMAGSMGAVIGSMSNQLASPPVATTARKSTMEPPNYVGSGVAPDIDVGNTASDEPMIMATEQEVIELTPNPQVTPKRPLLYWYEQCSIYAAVAKHCYITGYNGGEPMQAVVDVNNIIGHYYGQQYENCWALTELGQTDKVEHYEPLDTDSIMMIIDDLCCELEHCY